jgi:hypothetical protein
MHFMVAACAQYRDGLAAERKSRSSFEPGLGAELGDDRPPGSLSAAPQARPKRSGVRRIHATDGARARKVEL